MSIDDYASLRNVLDAAFEQAASGKGRERHSNGLRFDDQPIFTIASTGSGLGFLTGQAKKKIIETETALHGGLPTQEAVSLAHNELLGAIVYLAAAVLQMHKSVDSGRPFF